MYANYIKCTRLYLLVFLSKYSYIASFVLQVYAYTSLVNSYDSQNSMIILTKQPANM